jgi:hypothetical protein
MFSEYEQIVTSIPDWQKMSSTNDIEWSTAKRLPTTSPAVALLKDCMMTEQKQIKHLQTIHEKECASNDDIDLLQKHDGMHAWASVPDSNNEWKRMVVELEKSKQGLVAQNERANTFQKKLVLQQLRKHAAQEGAPPFSMPLWKLVVQKRMTETDTVLPKTYEIWRATETNFDQRRPAVILDAN